MVLEPFGQHGLDAHRGLFDQRRVGRVGRGGPQRALVLGEAPRVRVSTIIIAAPINPR